MPVVLPIGAAGVGMGLGIGVASCDFLYAMLRPSPKLPWLIRLPITYGNALCAFLGGLLNGCFAAFLPMGVGLPGLGRHGVSQPAAVAAMVLILVVPPLCLPCQPSEIRADLLLLIITLWHHGYLLAWPAWLNSGIASGDLHPDLYLGVVVTSALSLAAHIRATLYDATQSPSAKSRASSSSTAKRHSREAPTTMPKAHAASSSRKAKDETAKPKQGLDAAPPAGKKHD